MKSKIDLEINNFKGLVEYYKEGKEANNDLQTVQNILQNENEKNNDPANYLFVNNIVGHDGDFDRNSKIWKDRFKAQVCYEDQRKDYSIWRKSRINMKPNVI